MQIKIEADAAVLKAIDKLTTALEKNAGNISVSQDTPAPVAPVATPVTHAPVPPVTMPPATVVPTQPTPAPVATPTPAPAPAAPAQTVAPTNPAPTVPVTTAPTYTLDQIAKAGASLLNFHLECEDDIQETIDAIKAQGCKVGMTIKPGTPVEELGYYLDQLDLVLVMSVEPGFGGQKFMPSALDKLRWLKAEKDRRGLKFLLEVDGGVDAATAPQCVAAGADVLVAGSAIFGAADPAAAVRAMAAL